MKVPYVTIEQTSAGRRASRLDSQKEYVR
jgi:hypothetical protein